MSSIPAHVDPEQRVRCALCGEITRPFTRVYCTKCGARHHLECWDLGGRCAEVSCDGRTCTDVLEAVLPPPPVAEAAPAVAEAPPPKAGPPTADGPSKRALFADALSAPYVRLDLETPLESLLDFAAALPLLPFALLLFHLLQAVLRFAAKGDLVGFRFLVEVFGVRTWNDAVGAGLVLTLAMALLLAMHWQLSTWRKRLDCSFFLDNTRGRIEYARRYAGSVLASWTVCRLDQIEAVAVESSVDGEAWHYRLVLVLDDRRVVGLSDEQAGRVGLETMNAFGALLAEQMSRPFFAGRPECFLSIGCGSMGQPKLSLRPYSFVRDNPYARVTALVALIWAVIAWGFLGAGWFR